MAQRKPNSTTPAESPAAEAKQALAQWRLALRYAAAAALPAAKDAAHAFGERASQLTEHKASLRERLDPTHTEKGGRAGDAADALLGKLGTPGKLAAKASLGSRAVARLRGEGREPGDEDAAENAADDSGEAEAREPSEDETTDNGTAPANGARAAPGPGETGGDDDGDEGADPLRADFRHAYTDEVENYEHRDAYAQAR